MPYRQAKVRRRNDATGVGTAPRSMTEGLPRFSRRVQPHGGASGRVRRALSTGSGGRGWPAPCALLSDWPPVPYESQACGDDRRLGRCRAPGHPRLHRDGALGPSAVNYRVGGTRGRAVGAPDGDRRQARAPNLQALHGAHLVRGRDGCGTCQGGARGHSFPGAAAYGGRSDAQ
jgi:hypothetical protein